MLQDRDDWAARAAATAKRLVALETESAKLTAALKGAKEAPKALQAKLLALFDQFAAAEARRGKSSDALAAAESSLNDAVRAARESDALAGQARERADRYEDMFVALDTYTLADEWITRHAPHTHAHAHAHAHEHAHAHAHAGTSRAVRPTTSLSS